MKPGEVLLKTLVDRCTGTEEEMIAFGTHIPGLPFSLLEATGNIGKVHPWTSDGQCHLRGGHPARTIGQTVQECNQTRFAGGPPGPPCFCFGGVGSARRVDNVNIETALESCPSESAKQFITEIATGEIEMMDLQKEGTVQ